MTSKYVALSLADLGVTKSHRRAHVSNDNPKSKAHFMTLKDRPEFSERFGSIETRAPSVALSSMGTAAIIATRASR